MTSIHLSSAVVSFVFAVAGCGGEAFLSASDGGLSATCPTSSPSGGESCSQPDLQCEYGSSNEATCNVLATCRGGQWEVRRPVVDACTTNPLPDGCPAILADVPVNHSCPGELGKICRYPEGNCGCTVPRFGPYPADASGQALWLCDTPQRGCPVPRPKAGTVCGADGQNCNYGGCLLPSGTDMLCVSGVWRTQFIACAQ